MRQYLTSDKPDLSPAINVICLLLAGAAFLFQSPMKLIIGLQDIMTSPSNLISDYMAIGGIGAALLNAAMMVAITHAMIKRMDLRLTGPLVAALLTVCGFSLFGKNMFNSIPLTLGVFLYARYRRQELSSVILTAIYCSCLGPVVSEVAFGFDLPALFALPLSWATGIVIGFCLHPLATNFARFHQGFNLYNSGFAAGVLGSLIAAIFRMFNYKLESQNQVYTERNGYLALFAVTVSLSLIALGIYALGRINWKDFVKGYRALLKESGRLVSDFPTFHGAGFTLINMGFVGLIAITYVVLIQGPVNGPILGGFFTITGFGAMGKHPRNITPVIAGTILCSLLNIYDYQSTGTILATLFSTTLAPISGYYGSGAGLIAGFLHAGLVHNLGYAHGGLNLYNNGFSGGFVAAIMVAILDSIRARKKEEDS